MANSNLSEAKRARNDEFYTQYADIEKEISAYLEYDPDVFRGKTILLPCDDPETSNFTRYFAQNFEKLGIKKLISTSYAVNSKKYEFSYQPTLFERNGSQYDKTKTVNNGKIFILTDDRTGNHKVDVEDLEWHYLAGDGDFRNEEVKRLCFESDIIITNPPFSLFREFLAWTVKSGKKFVIIGNLNAIAYKDVFPLIKNDQMWMGHGFQAGNAYFLMGITKEFAEGVYDPLTGLVKFRNVCWFTNLDHGRRHQPMPLMTMAENLKYSRHKEIKGKESYDHYDNYDAIEVPYTDAIPSDYDGIMGVPVSFLDKYSPEQFEIVGSNRGIDQDPNGIYGRGSFLNGKETYKRLFIKHRKPTNDHKFKNRYNS